MKIYNLLFLASFFGFLHLNDCLGQKTCKTAMTNMDFNQYKAAIESESFSSTQMEIAKSGGKCLSCSQIKAIMEIFSFENMKLEYAKWAFPKCVDKGNYYTLNSAFSFSSSKTDLNNFVNGQSSEGDSEDLPETENVPVPPKKVVVKPAVEPAEEPIEREVFEDYSDAFKWAEKQMNAFFVMTFGNGENQIDDRRDLYNPTDKVLPPKGPRIVITSPVINRENNFTAASKQKSCKVTGVIGSSIAIYEVFINDNEAIINQNGEFSGEVLLGVGSNQVTIKAKDVKGQVAKIGFKIIREGQQVQPPKEDPKQNPVPGFVSEIDQNVPKLKNANNDAIAVVIGNSKYNKTKPVDFAVNDARSVKNYLIQLLGYKEGNILYYENATLGDLNTIFGTKANPKGRLFNSLKQGVSDVIIYYSGHGAPGLKDNKAYLVPIEADPNYLENSGYALDVLYGNLKTLPAKSITFISDACFSGANVFDKISPMVIRSKEPVKDGLGNTTILNSCKGTEVSCWNNEQQHGLFTFYLLKAMKDYQATDTNKDRQITTGEIFNSLSDNNEAVPYYARRQYGLTQTPVIQGPKTKVLFKY